MGFSRSENKGVARNPLSASLKVLPKPQFLPGFQRFRKVFAEFLGQRSEVICLPGSARRAGVPARATALSDWLSCLGLKAVCGGVGSDYLITSQCCKREPHDPGTESPDRGHQ